MGQEYSKLKSLQSIFSALADYNRIRIINFLLNVDSASLNEISDYLGENKRKVFYHIDKLVRADVISKVSKGRYKVNKNMKTLLNQLMVFITRGKLKDKYIIIGDKAVEMNTFYRLLYERYPFLKSSQLLNDVINILSSLPPRIIKVELLLAMLISMLHKKALHEYTDVINKDLFYIPNINAERELSSFISKTYKARIIEKYFPEYYHDYIYTKKIMVDVFSYLYRPERIALCLDNYDKINKSLIMYAHEIMLFIHKDNFKERDKIYEVFSGLPHDSKITIYIDSDIILSVFRDFIYKVDNMLQNDITYIFKSSILDNAFFPIIHKMIKKREVIITDDKTIIFRDGLKVLNTKFSQVLGSLGINIEIINSLNINEILTSFIRYLDVKNKKIPISNDNYTYISLYNLKDIPLEKIIDVIKRLKDSLVYLSNSPKILLAILDRANLFIKQYKYIGDLIDCLYPLSYQILSVEDIKTAIQMIEKGQISYIKLEH